MCEHVNCVFWYLLMCVRGLTVEAGGQCKLVYASVSGHAFVAAAGRQEGWGAFISPLSGSRKSNARWELSWQQFSSDRSAALFQFMTKEFTTRQSQSQYRDKYSPSTRSCPPLYQAFGLTVITPTVNPLTRGEEKALGSRSFGWIYGPKWTKFT